MEGKKDVGKENKSWTFLKKKNVPAHQGIWATKEPYFHFKFFYTVSIAV